MYNMTQIKLGKGKIKSTSAISAVFYTCDCMVLHLTWNNIKSPLYGKYIKIYNNKKRQNIDQIDLYNVFDYI